MPFDKQPTLRGDLLELRPLQPDDFDALYAVASDTLIWEQHPARNRHEPAVFRVFFDDALASGGALLAIDGATGTAIRSSRYHGCDEAAGEVAIGWTFLARRCWGGAYNGEMKRLMLGHVFRSVRSVVLRIGPDDRRPQRAAEKIGGARDGMRKDATGLEAVVYRIRAADLSG